MNALAQIIVERALNALPEGLLIALGAWLLLRIMARQNSGTRFAVWMVALAGVLALPFLGGMAAATPALSLHHRAEVTVPSFWAILFLALWIPIALLALARVAAGVFQVRRLRRTCTEIPAQDLDCSLGAILAGTRRRVRLLVSEETRVPAAIGFFRPAIVLPAWSLREMTPEELRPILIHELAHLRRHDDWTNLFQKIVRAVFFFHPAVWWIDARLSLEREMACDDAVLAATGNPKAYAGCLIGLLERGCARRGWTMAQAAVAHARDASVRIARILRLGAPATTRVGRFALGLAATVSIVCSGILLWAPRLLVFAPETPSLAHIAPLDAGDLTPPPVMPAAWHPNRQPSLVHEATLMTAPENPAATHPAATRGPAEHKRHAAALTLASAKPAERTVAAAVPPPAFVVFEMTDSTAPAPPRAIKAHAVQPPQRAHAPALQIETVQLVEEDTNGLHLQIIRMVFTVPAQIAAGTALPQSI